MSEKSVDYKLSRRAKWILRLMYAPDPDGSPRPIYGRTRIMKAMFLVQRKLRKEFNTSAGFEFKAYKYGPFDEDVYEALEDLQRKNLVEKMPADEHASPRDEPKYELTQAGTIEAGKLYDQLDDQQQKLLEWVRYEQADRPLGSLLSYVYRKYPDMTTESEIADRLVD